MQIFVFLKKNPHANTTRPYMPHYVPASCPVQIKLQSLLHFNSRLRCLCECCPDL